MTSNANTSVLGGEEGAVRAVFGELSNAWANGDADVFAGLFTEDATGALAVPPSMIRPWRWYSSITLVSPVRTRREAVRSQGSVKRRASVSS
jgi:hypothetical protein